MTSWQDHLWKELDEQTPVDQIKTTGEWIAHITHELLPALARRRREQARAVVDSYGGDKTRLAEEIGTRRGTITRLLDEARALNRPKGPRPPAED